MTSRIRREPSRRKRDSRGTTAKSNTARKQAEEALLKAGALQSAIFNSANLLHEAARNQGKMLESLALKDPLTGLANRRLLAERMSMALVHARRNKSTMAVVYLDLDGFKQINNTLGHGAGDALLKMVAGRLVATVREEDTVARLGGDEFIIALWNVSGTDDAAKVGLKVIEAVAQPYGIEGHTVSITTSAGIAIYPVHGQDADTLMKSADLVLYEAKRAGKNACRISERTD